MKHWMRFLRSSSPLVIVGLLATSALATPQPPFLSPPFPPVAGESDLTSFPQPATSGINIDWMVLPSGVNFLYLYQVENPSTTTVDLFSITFNTGSVISAGTLPGDNLDLLTGNHPLHAHTAAFFPVLAGLPAEEEGYTLQLLTGSGGGGLPLTSISPSNVTWTFRPLLRGRQSDTLFILGDTPPELRNTVAQDRIPPSPWGSLAPGGDPVAAPGEEALIFVPEPGTLLLLGSGLLGAAAWARRRFPKKGDRATTSV